jgi:hypothetical protein
VKTELARVAPAIIAEIAKLKNCCENQQNNIECSQSFSYKTKSNGNCPDILTGGGALLA